MNTHSLADYWEPTEPSEFEISEPALRENARSRMPRPEPMTLETVLALAKRLSTAEKFKLIERLLVEIEPIVERNAPKKRRSPSGMSERQSLTEKEVEELKRKLWGKQGERRPTRVIRLEGLWKDVPFDASTDEIRQARRELSEALKRRAEKL